MAQLMTLRKSSDGGLIGKGTNQVTSGILKILVIVLKASCV